MSTMILATKNNSFFGINELFLQFINIGVDKKYIRQSHKAITSIKSSESLELEKRNVDMHNFTFPRTLGWRLGIVIGLKNQISPK